MLKNRILSFFYRTRKRMSEHRSGLLVVGIFSIVFASFAADSVDNKKEIKKDSLHNFSLAANLFHHGIFSMNKTSEDPRELEPSLPRTTPAIRVGLALQPSAERLQPNKKADARGPIIYAHLANLPNCPRMDNRSPGRIPGMDADSQAMGSRRVTICGGLGFSFIVARQHILLGKSHLHLSAFAQHLSGSILSQTEQDKRPPAGTLR